MTSSTRDADLHVLLEEVDENRVVRYVTEGVLRASHRKLDEAPWDNLGLPYQRSFEGDKTPLPTDTPAELVLDLHPTSTVFNAGHRIRVTIMGADADNTESTGAPNPTIAVYHSQTHPSHITLPTVP
ncbi:MAG: hypothetical protein JSV80_09695 [Acidobacteriota bacterium]|nr:MAG: hypothetical protein JSV80_09695 [Acidobacteriota bacterium]